MWKTRILAQGFAWSGLILGLSTACLVGCGLDAGVRHDPAPAQFLQQALNAAPDEREQMWARARKEPGGPQAKLHVALLQSLPAHSGYDLLSARRALQRLGSDDDDEIAAVARIRLAELDMTRSCSAQNQDLQKRLKKVIDIERTLDEEGHDRPSDPGR